MTVALEPSKLETLLARLRASPRLAHGFLFAARHEDETPEFHMEIIDLWHSAAPFVQTEAFRGGAKSTTAEEAIATMALFRKFRNALVIGASEERAVERVASIKNEIENNERIHQLFGNQVGNKWWGSTKAVLANGVCIQAKGRGQSMRGTKHLNDRPDILFLDDIEQDDEFIPTEENCRKVIQWLLSVAIPALHPTRRRVRVAGTPSSPFSLTMQLRRARGWVTRKYPIMAKDELSGAWKSTWPARFTLGWIEAEKERYADLHQTTIFEQEYMLEPIDAASQIFTPAMLKVDPHIKRVWQPTWAFYDPARTATVRSGKTSATTGKAVWSWMGTKLVVWHISGNVWKPDDTIKDLFNTDDEYAPVQIGVEEDGLNEFLLQPIRSAMVTRGHSLPIRAMRAPKSKFDFIKGLQPFFAASDVIFAQELSSSVKNQFLTFPAGVIDAPNALAYALKMRPGQPVYGAFSVQHIVPELEPFKRAPLWLALNATKICTSGVLLQLFDGQLRVIADWLTEEPPGVSLRHIIQMANIEAGGQVKLCAGVQHFGDYDTVGLRASAGKIPVTLNQMGAPHFGREELRALFTRQPGGKVPVQISTNATWTMRALNGGYARDIDKRGILEEFAVDNQYKVVMEGIESILASARVITEDSGDNSRNYGTTKDGTRYVSALPNRSR